MTIGAISGLTISYLISLFFAQLRHSRIHERNEIDETKGIPFIGNVAMDSNNPLALKESFNNLCTKILLKQDVKMITITSTSSGEGKTFIATNLAKAYSAMDKKVLLIDMNSYHPEIADLFEITNDKTIADVLEGRCDVHDAVCLTSFPNLDILVSGMLPEGVNSLLASKKREDLFKDLQRHYDLIIIDTPESGRFIDAVPMMKQSQLNLYVARAKATRKQSLVNAELIQQDYDVENMYFILNSITKQTTHTGKIGRGSYKKLKSPESQKVKVSYVPEALRKIALWFY
jgi:capsular exopolysaccharide synthesis family protein